MDANAGIYKIMTPVVMAHPALFEARAFKRNGKETGEKKFGAMLVFDPAHPDFDALKAHAAKLARAKWPGIASLKTVKFPFRSGDKVKADRIADRQKKGIEPADDGKADFMVGKVCLKAASKFAPRLSVIENGKIVELENGSPAWVAAKSKFYFGVEVLAEINLVPYDKIKDGDQDGVTAYLNQVLSTGKGKKLSTGGAPAVETFKGYVGSASATDPTGASEDDEIPY